MLNFLRRLPLDFPKFICNFSRDFLTDKCIENFKKAVLGLLGHVTPSIVFSRILRSEALVHKSYFFRKTVLRKLFDIRFSYKHCNFSRVCVLVKMASKTVTRSILATCNTTCFVSRQIWTWVVCSNVAEHFARFCCPFYRGFSGGCTRVLYISGKLPWNISGYKVNDIVFKI